MKKIQEIIKLLYEIVGLLRDIKYNTDRLRL